MNLLLLFSMAGYDALVRNFVEQTFPFRNSGKKPRKWGSHQIKQRQRPDKDWYKSAKW